MAKNQQAWLERLSSCLHGSQNMTTINCNVEKLTCLMPVWGLSEPPRGSKRSSIFLQNSNSDCPDHHHHHSLPVVWSWSQSRMNTTRQFLLSRTPATQLHTIVYTVHSSTSSQHPKPFLNTRTMKQHRGAWVRIFKQALRKWPNTSSNHQKT